jgi:S-adenosyl-L-methionine hydrolase (adenosine-forming)
MSTITLTTDFGEDSPYFAALKGVILVTNPRARLLDLSHNIPPQEVRHAAFFLASAIPYFPRDVIHVVVVDPGVGSERALLYVEAGGHRLLVPDNGCWTPLSDLAPSPPRVRKLAEPRYWRSSVTATFHGRDILAPVAGWLSRGLNPELLGPSLTDWVRLEWPVPRLEPDRLAGEVLFVDHFGNLITNVPGEALAAFAGRPVRITVGPEEVRRRVRTYAEVEPGTTVALVSSGGLLEVAVNQGNAADRLRARVGTPVTVTALAPGRPAAG